MNLGLDGTVAVVTGAGSGMGRATVLALLDAGVSVVAADVSEAALPSRASSPQLAVQRCDVRSEQEVKHLIERAVEEFGALNSVFNAAGICKEEALVAIGDVWRDTLDINLNGVINVARHAIPALKAAGGGSIVNWASNSAFRASPNLSAYCVSKAAIVMLTKCIAVEHAADGIRANVVCPGFVDTPMIQSMAATYGSEKEWRDHVKSLQPLGIGSPESVADVAVLLASDLTRHMTGAAVSVDGGALAGAPFLAPPRSA